LGASRLSALTLNFIHFALLQVALAWVLLWLSKRWSVALFAVGLLLTAGAPFWWVGGLMDFRIDFMAMSLFGVFACLLLRSGVCASRGWSLAAGALAGLCVLTRFLTMLYFTALFGILFVAFAARWWFGRGRRPESAARVVNLVLAGAVLVGCCLPGVWVHRHGL